jgi:hypothetical protein
MTKQQFDDPLKDLEAALAVEPSPAFAARVRARVTGPRNRRAWLGWQGLAAAAIVALAVVGAGLWRASISDVRTLRTVAVVAEVPAASGVASAAVVAKSIASVKVLPVATSRPSAGHAPSPEVLVPPDQAIAVNRFLAGLRELKTARLAAEAPVVVLEELPQITPVRIEPIRIDPLVPNSPSSGGKEKDR